MRRHLHTTLVPSTCLLLAFQPLGCSGDRGEDTAGMSGTSGITAGSGTAGSATAGSATAGSASATGTSTGGSASAGTSAGSGSTTGSPKFDLGAIPDAGNGCPPDMPDCQDFCDPDFTPDDFVDPIIKCQWSDQSTLTTPVVADLNDDGIIEIAFITWGNPKGKLIIIRGDDCSLIYSGPAGMFGERSQLAAADLDGDGDYELAGLVPNAQGYGIHVVRVVDDQGNIIADSVAANVTGSSWGDGGPAIANLDGQGPPEIVYGGMALRLENGALTTLFNNPAPSGYWGILSTVADVDLDGTPEIVVGNRIYDGVTGADETPPSVVNFPGGYPAVAQFDAGTPEPEIVLLSSGANISELRIYHPVTGDVLLGPISLGSKWGGPPTVGDFDGDEKPEVAAAGVSDYILFDPDCDANPLPAYCAQQGIRWRKQTQDGSSGSTGSTLFDFNGDGIMEVIYRDEVKLRIYDGPTGNVLSQFDIGSGTILENPVVADVDLDGSAELIVPSHQSFGNTRGLYVLEDPQDKWVEARSIWNQHTYHITNIQEDGTIPAVEANNWVDWNNFRQQVGPDPLGKKPCKPKPEG